MNLQSGGAKNLNLVTASHYLPWIVEALDTARAQGFALPVVYNTGGYETVDAVQTLAGYVDVWLTDYKYADGALAAALSAARDYPAVADAALRQMLLQTGAPVYDADGYLQKGVIVRHLALPGHVADSKAVLRRLAELRAETGVAFIPSLMSQFTPFYKAAEHGLGRRITTYEYRQVIDEAVRLGLTDGYMQEKSLSLIHISRRHDHRRHGGHVWLCHGHTTPFYILCRTLYRFIPKKSTKIRRIFCVERKNPAGWENCDSCCQPRNETV